MDKDNKSDAPSETKKWYEDFPKSAPIAQSQRPNETTEELKVRAQKALNGESAAYELKQSRTRGSDYSWLKTALVQGTTSDKVAASVVLIQDSPKHNLSRLQSLVSKVKASKSDHCSNAAFTLKDLFLNDLLHPDLKLVKFEDQNFEKLKSAGNENKLLAHWYFEDQLKECYANFVDSLAEIATNSVETNREKVVGVLCELLVRNSEQEQKLLSSLVNKIGDPCNRVSSKAIFCLNKLLDEHPNMKGVVLNETERLLFRPNVSPRVQYYAICLLTQFVLDKEEEEIATTLVDVYFAFFKACLKKGEPDSRMMGAILTGVNRAYNFAKIDGEKMKEHVDSVFKIVHLGTFNVSLNALNLLFQVSGKTPSISDRFYTAFYNKLSDPEIGRATNKAVILNLYMRAVRSDKSLSRSAAFIKRMLQVSCDCFPPNMICAVLFIISQIIKGRKDLRNILSRSYIKTIKVEETVAESADIEQDEIQEVPIEVDKETGEEMKGDLKQKAKKRKNKKGKELKEIEIKEDEEGTSEISIKQETNDIILSNVVIGPLPTEDIKEEIHIKEEDCKVKTYDAFCRNPLYAGGYNALFPEIKALISHFHPSVALFARNIFNNQTIEYTGDPLKDLSLVRFLDRFAFKNPKRLSEIDMKKKRAPLARNAVYEPKGARKLAVNSTSYLNMDEKQVPVDETFLYKHFKLNQISKTTKEDEDDDNSSVNSEEFNEMLDEMAGNNEDCDIDDMDIAANFVEGEKAKGKSSKDDDDDDDYDELNNMDEESMDGEDFDEMDEELNEFDQEDVDDEEMGDFDEGVSFDKFNDEESGSDIDLDELDDDASDIDFGDEEKTSKKGKKKAADEDVFVCAEKFAEMLEEQGASKMKSGASNTLSDLDGTNFKQLKWEMNRGNNFSRKTYGKKGRGKRSNVQKG